MILRGFHYLSFWLCARCVSLLGTLDRNIVPPQTRRNLGCKCLRRGNDSVLNNRTNQIRVGFVFIGQHAYGADTILFKKASFQRHDYGTWRRCSSLVSKPVRIVCASDVIVTRWCAIFPNPLTRKNALQVCQIGKNHYRSVETLRCLTYERLQ